MNEELDQFVRKVQDFPVEGIIFHDIAPLLRGHFDACIQALEAQLEAREWAEIDAVVGVESRGFILAAALAQRQRKGFIPVRKAGKLPPPVVSCKYELEYGSGTLEMHTGTGRVLVVDDVLATGGTLCGAADLACDAGYQVAQLLVLINLGRVPEFRWRGIRPRAVILH